MEQRIHTVVLIHGKHGSPNMGWLPWMRAQLESRGLRVEAPTFPPEDDSQPSDWFMKLDKLGIDLAATAFIAHARGAMALLRWVDKLPVTTRIPHIITVSCNFDYQPDRKDGDEFYSSPLDYVGLQQKCQKFTVVHSQDDPYVPIQAGQELAKHLHATFKPYKSAGHFGNEKREAPELLDQLSV